MGLRGPQPKPTALRKYEGRYISPNATAGEPKLPQGMPAKPRMSRAASQVWDELADDMNRVGVLSTVDGRAFAQLCEDEALLSVAYAGIWRTVAEIMAEAKKRGEKITRERALMIAMSDKEYRTAFGTLRDIASRANIERREFGLTPAARTRIKVDDSTGTVTVVAPSASAWDSIESKLCGSA